MGNNIKLDLTLDLGDKVLMGTRLN